MVVSVPSAQKQAHSAQAFDVSIIARGNRVFLIIDFLQWKPMRLSDAHEPNCEPQSRFERRATINDKADDGLAWRANPARCRATTPSFRQIRLTFHLRLLTPKTEKQITISRSLSGSLPMVGLQSYVGELVMYHGFFYEIVRIAVRGDEVRCIAYSDELDKEAELSIADVFLGLAA
jgi:hypothetical protein